MSDAPTMRAVVCRAFGPVEDLTLQSVPVPQPAANEVRVAVRYAALNFPDTLIVQGLYQMRPDCPFVPGSEAAGVVDAVGSGVRGFAPGDRVMALPLLGAFAERVCVPARAVLPLPEGLPMDAAAGFTMVYATAYHAFKQRAQLAAGETVAVLGAAGGVGLASVALGKTMGARVIACASDESKLAAAREAGADETVDYTREDLRERLKALTDGRGVDVVVDPVGGALTEPALRATAWDGRYLVIGFASGEIPKIPFNLPLLKGLHIVGVFWGSWIAQQPEASEENMRELFGMIASGKLAPPRSQAFALENFAEAFAALTGRRAIGKVLLKISAGG